MNGFAELQRRLASLSDPRTLQDLHNLAGRDVAELVDAGFAGEHDPNGDPWLPSKAAQREGRKTLRKTGALQDGIQWKADSRGVIFRTTGKANRYAAFHQYGSRASQRFQREDGRFLSNKRAGRSKKMVYVVEISGLPARPFLPEGDLPLPYERKLSATFRQYFRERFG